MLLQYSKLLLVACRVRLVAYRLTNDLLELAQAHTFIRAPPSIPGIIDDLRDARKRYYKQLFEAHVYCVWASNRQRRV